MDDQCKSNGWARSEVEEKIIGFAVDVHERIETLSARYLAELGRHNHVTPTLFLNQLKALHSCAVQIFQKDDAYKR